MVQTDSVVLKKKCQSIAIGHLSESGDRKSLDLFFTKYDGIAMLKKKNPDINISLFIKRFLSFQNKHNILNLKKRLNNRPIGHISHLRKSSNK